MGGGEGVRRNKMDGVRSPGECIEIDKGGYVFSGRRCVYFGLYRYLLLCWDCCLLAEWRVLCPI